MKNLFSLALILFSIACGNSEKNDKQENPSTSPTNPGFTQNGNLVKGEGNWYEFDDQGSIELYFIPTSEEENSEPSDEELDTLAESIENDLEKDTANLSLTGFKLPAWKRTKPGVVDTAKAPVNTPKVPEAPPSPTNTSRTLETRTSSSSLEAPAPTPKAPKVQEFAFRARTGQIGPGSYKEFRVLRVVDFDIESDPKVFAEQLPFGKKVYFAIPRSKKVNKDDRVLSKSELERPWFAKQVKSLSTDNRLEYKVREDLSTDDHQIVRVIKTYDPKTRRQLTYDDETERLYAFYREYNGKEYSFVPADIWERYNLPRR